jgi:hypothetical protein
MSDDVDLSDLDKEYEQAGVIPDRVYNVEVIEAKVSYTKTNKRQLAWKLAIISPEKYVGSQLYLNRLLEGNDTASYWSKQLLQQLGYTGKLGELKMESFIGQQWQVETKQDGDFKRVTFLKKLEAKPQQDKKDFEDDIPF